MTCLIRIAHQNLMLVLYYIRFHVYTYVDTCTCIPVVGLLMRQKSADEASITYIALLTYRKEDY